ncbi:MAG: histidine phosphatase family protein [Spirochaetia bacterium]|jgi:broad specificity phosphatase PhoE|nr:histidine phosphatase family protein [Spirochaetia bacterium]
MSIYVVRHGEKEKGDFYSNALPLNDQPLSQKGRSQAQRLVGFFKEIEIASIYISEYRRTGQTIERVLEDKALEPCIDGRLNEIDVGDTEKLSDEEIKERYPAFWMMYLERKADFRFPNGESGEEAGSRIFSLFESLDVKRNHILVSHDGIIRTLLCKVLMIPTYRRHLFQIDTCSITVFSYVDEFRCWAIPKINMTLQGNG